MKQQPRLSRRHLIGLGSAAVVTCVGRVLLGRSRPEPGRWEPRPAGKPVGSAVLDQLAPAGAAYLELRPEEADAAWLRRSLGLGEADLAAVLEAPGGPHRERLGGAHRDDFRHARVVKLDGWTLSETELRLAALAHLTL